MELHQQQFRATNAIDWKECFPHKTVETNETNELLFKYSFKLDILNKTVNDNGHPWMSGWNKNCPIKGKTMLIIKNMFGQKTLYSACSPT